LWPFVVQKDLELSPPCAPLSNNQTLKRLHKDWQNPWQKALITQSQDPSGYQWQHQPLQSVGIVVHRLLYQISQADLDHWSKDFFSFTYIQDLLLQAGTRTYHLDAAVLTVQEALTKTLNDPKGRWILANRPHAHSEYALTAQYNGRIQRVILDRTFIDSGIRWIIDYKITTIPVNQVGFLQQQFQEHQQQLERYARIFQSISSEPIRLGLYFPLLSLWHEWAFLGPELPPEF
jgi:hypothetical protein